MFSGVAKNDIFIKSQKYLRHQNTVYNTNKIVSLYQFSISILCFSFIALKNRNIMLKALCKEHLVKWLWNLDDRRNSLVIEECCWILKCEDWITIAKCSR